MTLLRVLLGDIGNMNRRDFIKMLGAGIVAFVAMPSMVLGRNRFDKFKPDFFCGDWVRVNSNGGYEKATKFINKHMENIVPPEYRKQVKIIVKELGSSGTEDPLRQRGSVGFRYVPENSWLDKIDAGERRYLKWDDGKGDVWTTVSTYPPCYDEELKSNHFYFGWAYEPKELRVFG